MKAVTLKSSDTRLPLTVVLGAGASMPVGIPSTGRLTEAVKTRLLAGPHHLGATVDFAKKVAKLLDVAAQYYEQAGLNFEYLLDLFEGGLALTRAWESKWPTISEACLTRLRDELSDVVDSSLLHDCIFVLKRVVLDEVTKASDHANIHASWSEYVSFWQRLASDFLLTIVTLNYDTVVEQSLCLDGSHQGFAPISNETVWRLDPRRLHSEPDDHRLYHLHGGIQLGVREYGADPNRFGYEDSFHDLYWHPTAEGAQQTMWGKSSPRSGSGRALEGGPIVTGLHKADKLLIEPLGSYYVETAAQLRRCPRLLVIGYGFGDPHINALLSRMTRTHGPDRRVAVIDYVDMLQEKGSNNRAEMQRMLQRWGECRFGFTPDYPYPWTSANGCAAFYFNGLLDAATAHADLERFLKGDRLPTAATTA